MINLLIIEAQQSYLTGLVDVLTQDSNITVIGSASNRLEGVALAKTLQPSVVMFDSDQLEIPMHQFLAEVNVAAPKAQLVISSSWERAVSVVELIKYGVVGYLCKENAYDQLKCALNTTAKGALYIAPNVTSLLVTELAKPRYSVDPKKVIASYSLTERELDVVKLIVRGFTNQQIADYLLLSQGTIRNYVSKILAKTSVPNRAHLILWTAQAGVIDIT